MRKKKKPNNKTYYIESYLLNWRKITEFPAKPP